VCGSNDNIGLPKGGLGAKQVERMGNRGAPVASRKKRKGAGTKFAATNNSPSGGRFNGGGRKKK